MNFQENDLYKTIDFPSEEILYKEKNSKFYGIAFPVSNEKEVKVILEQLRKTHFSARHWCYAYQIGTEKTHYRTNDDGEPNNSAGMPIYGQIQSFEVTNVLVVVIRYFGGIKLGVSGLISAYKIAAQMALENTTIVNKTINKHFIIVFEYIHMNKVMRIIKEKNLEIIAQRMDMNCEIEIAIRKKNVQNLLDIFKNLHEVKLIEK